MKISVRTAALANLNHWKAGQGGRIKANRPPEVYRACEHVAQQWAAIRDPLILTPEELGIAVKTAITQERNRRQKNTPPPESADEFWAQVSAIAEHWGIQTRREQWERSAKTPEKAPAMNAREPDTRGDSEKNPKPETAKARAA
jgi:hypothetical protein